MPAVPFRIPSPLVVLAALAATVGPVTAAPPPDFVAAAVESAKLLASDGSADDAFGVSVAVDGDVVVVGAYFDDPSGSNSGSAYVFVRPAAGWTGTLTESARLVPSDPFAGDEFGRAVAISGSTVAVSAPGDDDNGSQSGSIYVFEEPGGGWTGNVTQLAKLLPSDAGSIQFGQNVAISGSTVVAGARGQFVGGLNSAGAVYVFTEPGGGWSGSLNDSAKLTASDAGASDQLGFSVAISGGTVTAGATGDDDGGSSAGAVYVFVEPGGGWSGSQTQSAKLRSSSGGFFSLLGTSVDVDGDRVLTGASFDASTGRAYLFEKPGGGWSGTQTETATLQPADGQSSDSFGVAVALEGDLALVGAYHHDDNGAESGAAYQFVRPADGWSGTVSSELELLPSDGTTSDQFGGSIALAGSTAVLGSIGDDDNSSASGSAYVFAVCGDALPLIAGSWHMVAPACVPGDGDTVEDVFGDDLAPADYASRWIVHRRDAASDAYVALGLGDSLEVGRGYWLKTLDAGQAIDVVGRPASTTCPVASALSDCHEITLVGAAGGRRNLVGHPFAAATPWKDVLVVDSGGTELTLDQAEAQGVLSPVIHTWSGAAYVPADGSTPGLEGSLEPSAGFWVEAFENATLRIPTEGAAARASTVAARGSRETASVVARPDSWFVRLVASSGSLVDPGNVFGQMRGRQARPGQDRHDLLEPAPFAAPWLTIVFPHPEWGGPSDAFTSDFRPRRARDEWTFEVRTDVPGREVELSWEGPAHILRRSRLVDESTGERMRPAPDGRYSFEMSETHRAFRWVLLPPRGR